MQENGSRAPEIGTDSRKKKIPRAVDRNFLKRKAREAFRRCQTELPAADFVLLYQKEALQLKRRALSALLQEAFLHYKRTFD